MLAGAAGSLAVLAAGRPAWATDAPRPGALRAPSLTVRDGQVVKAIRPGRALDDLVHLSETIGPRIGGTESELRAAEFGARRLERAGCHVWLEPFPVADKFLADIGDPGDQLPDDICWQAGASPDAGLDVSVVGPAVDVGSATAPAWPADPAAITGAVVLADDAQHADAATRVNLRAAFVADAATRGAAAVVLLPADLAYPRRAQAASLRLVPTTPGSPPPPPTNLTSVPVVGVAQVQKRLMREDLAVRPLQLEVTTTAHRGLTSHNVLGDIRGRSGSGGPLVYISGHYDSVIGAPGANDDGSGTVLTTELARVLGSLRRTNATLRFALWGSEEQGLIGSRFHVAELELPRPGPDRRGVPERHGRHQLGPRHALLAAVVHRGSPTRQPTRSRAAATRLGYDPQISEVTLRGASDHQSFQEVGIAAANFSWRGEATPALLEPPYHSPEDTIARNVSIDRLTVSMELIGCAAYDLASQAS